MRDARRSAVSRNYDADDAELDQLKKEHDEFAAQTLPRGTPLRTRRNEVWRLLCALRRTQRTRDLYRSVH